MEAGGDLWRKSRGPVTKITGAFPANCDVYHQRTCGAALFLIQLLLSIDACRRLQTGWTNRLRLREAKAAGSR